MDGEQRRAERRRCWCCPRGWQVGWLVPCGVYVHGVHFLVFPVWSVMKGGGDRGGRYGVHSSEKCVPRFPSSTWEGQSCGRLTRRLPGLVEPLVSNRYIKPVCVRVRLCACAASASTTRTKAWFFVCTRHGQCRSRFRCRRRIACTHFRSLWDEMAETVSLMR